MSLAFEHIKNQIWNYLDEIPDPEIPVISIVELGVVRDLEITNAGISIFITPTYTGCPATNIFEEDIKKKLSDEGFKNINIKYTYAPAWTTDWMSEETKEKLEKHGIAPPNPKEQKSCPYCKSSQTEKISEFGSTACKALYTCNDCKMPFEYFKCI